MDKLKSFSEAFWFAPGDVFSRAAERNIWVKQLFKRPVLDIGCGDASVSRLLFEKRQKIDFGVDIDKEAVEKAGESGFYKKVMVADAARLPFKNASLQTVISNSTFEHIKNDLKAIAEVSRVLKAGGCFFLTVPGRRLKNTLKGIIKNEDKFNRLNQRINHLHYRDHSEWIKILQKHGLVVKTCRYYFPKRAVKIWLRLFQIATFRPYKRELWSYLKDSSYGKLFPKKLIAKIIVWYLRPFLRRTFDRSGCWLFVIAEKL